MQILLYTFDDKRSGQIIRQEQNKQCFYDVTLGLAHATIYAVTSNTYYIFWMCVFSLSYAACNVLAPYCHLWPVWLYSIFSHMSWIARFSKKKLMNTKCILIFSSTFYSKNNWAIYDKNVFWSSCKDSSCLSNFNETLILLTDFRKILKYQILRQIMARLIVLVTMLRKCLKWNEKAKLITIIIKFAQNENT